MFYSIPVNSEQIITTTPLDAKSITHVFFESKNDGIFNYKKVADNITITVDGKMICRDMPILPFTSSAPYGTNRLSWQSIALEVGLNVSLSEIKISSQVCNDFNVVFVCQPQPLKEIKGFDFVEAKKITIKEFVTQAELDKSVLEKLTELDGGSVKIANTIYTPDFKKSVGIFNNTNSSLTSDEIINVLIGKVRAYVSPEYCVVLSNANKQQFEAQLEGAIDGSPGNYRYRIYYKYRRNASDVSKDDFYQDFKYVMRYQSIMGNAGEWGVEKTVSLDRSPEQMFFYQLASKTSSTDDAKVVEQPDIMLNFTISGTPTEELAPETDMILFQATNSTPWRECAYRFQSEMPKSFMFTYDYNRMNGNPLNAGSCSALYSKNPFPNTWDVYLFFVYKKVL